jgi:hypothetical protein
MYRRWQKYHSLGQTLELNFVHYSSTLIAFNLNPRLFGVCVCVCVCVCALSLRRTAQLGSVNEPRVPTIRVCALTGWQLLIQH